MIDIKKKAPRKRTVGCVSLVDGHKPITEIPKPRHKLFPDIAQKPKYGQDYVK